jgi:Ala-tRNA(Pro) deacylase
MTVMERVKQFLEEQGLDFDVICHQETFTTVEEAKAAGVTASHVAKTLVIKGRKGDILAVLPASGRIDMHKLKDIVDDNHARLATEEEMEKEFKDVELGAVPPLGDLYGLPVFMDAQLEKVDEVIFAGGTHSDSIKLSGTDFLKVTHPRVVDLAMGPGEVMI